MTTGYEVFLIATRPYPEKALGTDVTTLASNCSRYQPGLFFYSERDARAYYNELLPETKLTCKIYRSIINVEKEPL